MKTHLRIRLLDLQVRFYRLPFKIPLPQQQRKTNRRKYANLKLKSIRTVNNIRMSLKMKNSYRERQG